MAKATRKQLAALRKARAARRRMAAPNPHKHRRPKSVYRPRRRRHVIGNPRTRSRRGRQNGTKIYVMRRGNTRRGRKNPEMFGMTGMSAGKAIFGGLVGVYAAKTVTPMVANVLPTVGSSSMISALVSAVVGWGGGMLIGKYDKTLGAGFLFGALMQAGSQVLNTFVTPNPLALSGLGDFAPAMFAVPENPIRRAAMMRAQGMLPAAGPTSSNLSGMAAAQMFQ